MKVCLTTYKDRLTTAVTGMLSFREQLHPCGRYETDVLYREHRSITLHGEGSRWLIETVLCSIHCRDKHSHHHHHKHSHRRSSYHLCPPLLVRQHRQHRQGVVYNGHFFASLARNDVLHDTHHTTQ